MTTTYVDCPICGESDMPKELEPVADEPGQGYVKCFNLCCASNGGTNMSALPQSKDIDWAMLIKERADADRELVEGLKELREVLKPEIGRLERQVRLLTEAWTEAQKLLGMEDVGLTPAGIRATAGDLRKDLDELEQRTIRRWTGPRGHEMMSGAWGGGVKLANGQWHVFAHHGDDPKIDALANDEQAITWCTTGELP